MATGQSGSEHPRGIFGVNGVYSESAESTFLTTPLTSSCGTGNTDSPCLPSERSVACSSGTL